MNEKETLQALQAAPPYNDKALYLHKTVTADPNISPKTFAIYGLVCQLLKGKPPGSLPTVPEISQRSAQSRAKIRAAMSRLHSLGYLTDEYLRFLPAGKTSEVSE